MIYFHLSYMELIQIFTFIIYLIFFFFTLKFTTIVDELLQILRENKSNLRIAGDIDLDENYVLMMYIK